MSSNLEDFGCSKFRLVYNLYLLNDSPKCKHTSMPLKILDTIRISVQICDLNKIHVQYARTYSAV